jgi:hypothetical protein
MKKIKQLFAAALLFCSTGTWAETWTDKTSLITNPSFETDAAISDLTGCGWATDRATGWTITPSSPSNAQVGIGNSSSTIQGIASSFSPSDGDKYFYMRENWNPNTTFSISQVISSSELPAGFYRLSVKAAMFSSVASTYTLSLQEGEQTETAATNSFSYAGTANNENWRDWSVTLIKRADDTDLTIKAAYKTPKENSGSKHYSLLLDNVKLEYLAQADVTSDNPIDVTSWLVNPSFELNTFNGTKDPASSIEQNAGGHKYATGWTFLIKETGWSNVASVTDAPADGNYAHETWAGNPEDFKVYQTINNLPEGVYEISASARTENSSADDICTYAKVGSTTTYSDPFDVTNIQSPWNGASNWQTLTTRFSIIGGGAAEVGIHSTKFMQFDNFHLTYLGSDLLLSELKSSFATFKATAEGLLTNSDYDNVVGTERTTLTNKKDVTPEETVAAWTTAVNELQEAIDAFTTAKANYDAYAEIRGVAIALSVTPGDAPTTAATAPAATNALNIAVYNATTASNFFDVTEIYTPSWSSMGTGTGQHWSGDTSLSYADEWRADTNPSSRNATVTLPEGSYVLMSAGRGSENTVVTMSANGTTITFASKGDTGYGIDKSGAANFSEGTYANDNNGRGWEWRYIPVTLDSETAVTVTQTLTRLSGSAWGSFSDFKILKVGVVATADDYAALSSAITAAEAKTLGFENGQYAPYNNVAALTALAQANAIDPAATNEQETVQAVTTALSGATWTANDGDVDAIYNGQFAEANGTNPKGWTRSNNGWGQQITGLTAETNGVATGTTTAWYYNNNGSWQYGNDGIYVMPLAANQAYELSFKYRKHGSDGQNWMKASVVNSNNEGMEVVQFTPAENSTTFVTAKAYFTTGAAGNYILSIEQNGNAHLTDVSLVKAASAGLTLNEDADYEVVNRTYYETINMNRTVKAGFNTVCLPFDLTAEQVANVFGDIAKVYTFLDVADGTNSTINFNTKEENTIEANVPVLIGTATASTAQTINRVVLKSGEAVVAGTNFDFVGTYAPMTVAEGDYFIGNGALYKSAGNTSLKAFRAYIKAKTEASVKMFINGEEFETSISEINGVAENGVIYNLAGQRISKMQKGINIVNGKKVLF